MALVMQQSYLQTRNLFTNPDFYKYKSDYVYMDMFDMENGYMCTGNDGSSRQTFKSMKHATQEFPIEGMFICVPAVIRDICTSCFADRISLLKTLELLILVVGTVSSNFVFCLPDVVSIPKTNENFRLLYDTKGRFRLHSIRDEEAKVCIFLLLNFKLITLTESN